jgi:NAD(P)-dependent dehydrogenase (short-subunit alcohol dehydrogenase family)
MTDFDLTGKSAIVTGGSQGIGAAVADRLEAAGAKVFIGDLNPPAASGRAYLKTNVADENAVSTLIHEANETHGGLDILVNNAGVHTDYNRFEEMTADALEKCLAVNTKGVAWGIKHAAPIIRDGGAIINVSSASAVVGVSGLAPYAASKAAVLALTQTAAIELAPRSVRVNAICPGSVRTPMALADGGEDLLEVEAAATPLGRICEPEEVAALIHFLAAPDCSFLTGQSINLCGGLTAGLSDNLWSKLAE